MSSRPSLQALCVVILACGGVGLYHLRAQPPAIPPPQEVTETQTVSRPSQTWRDEPHSDFYQTIIRNNLFAPLGTVLNPKPRPGANLTLVGTFLAPDAGRSTALIKQASTGRLLTVTVGDVLGDATVLKIESKQVTLDPHGKKPVVLRLPGFVFLN